MKKINRKGFTLIELIAVIVILSIILIVVVPNLIETYKQSKLKSEGMFVKQLTKSIESYVSLNGSNLEYTDFGEAKKSLIVEDTDKSYTVKISKSTIKIQDIIDSNIIEENEYRNPGNKDKKCDKEAEIEVYRDSDYVYCFKIKKDSFDCLTDEYKQSIGEDAIDTCIWEKIGE